LQIVFGVLCSAEGCPIAIEVFARNVGDPDTLAAQISKIKDRFGLKRVVMVVGLQPTGLSRGDRGMITALRAPAIQKLAAEDGPLQMSLFDERDLAEITSPDFPGERLIVCRNPALAVERTRKREELLGATEQQLQRIQARVRRAANPLRGADKIGAAVGAVLNRRKVGKHFAYSATDTDLRFAHKTEQIAAEAALDRIYVLRTSLAQPATAAADVVRAYQSLSRVERFFRSTKTVDLEVRAVFHWTDPRVRAHVFLCMLAYYLQWHMRRALAPMLFDDHERAAGEALRNSPVAKVQPSPAAKRKATTKQSEADQPVCSFRSLLRHLACLTRNTVRVGHDQTTTLFTAPTAVQQRAFELLGVARQT